MRESRITRVLALLCLAVFALCLLLVLLRASSAYWELVENGEAAYIRRTALQYLTTRVRQAERVQTGKLEGCEALVLQEVIDGEPYTTWVYCYEGWLRELYAVPGAKLPPQAGAPLLEAEEFSLCLDGSLLTMTFRGEQLLVYLPAGKAVDP